MEILYEHNTTRHPHVLLCIPPSVPRQLCLPLGPLTSELELPPSRASLCPTADQSSRHSGGSQMSLPGGGVQSVLASVLHPRSSQLTFLSETVYVFAGLLPLLHKKRWLQEHRTSSVLFTATPLCLEQCWALRRQKAMLTEGSLGSPIWGARMKVTG